VLASLKELANLRLRYVLGQEEGVKRINGQQAVNGYIGNTLDWRIKVGFVRMSRELEAEETDGPGVVLRQHLSYSAADRLACPEESDLGVIPIFAQLSSADGQSCFSK